MRPSDQPAESPQRQVWCRFSSAKTLLIRRRNTGLRPASTSRAAVRNGRLSAVRYISGVHRGWRPLIPGARRRYTRVSRTLTLLQLLISEHRFRHVRGYRETPALVARHLRWKKHAKSRPSKSTQAWTPFLCGKVSMLTASYAVPQAGTAFNSFREHLMLQLRPRHLGGPVRGVSAEASCSSKRAPASMVVMA